eukprot:3791227-Ditylum_brightwellii.AAC.1
MTNSSTLEGWLKKSNFSKLIDDPIPATVRLEACRSHAMQMMKNGIKDYSQWFPGNKNNVPKHFRIVQLPNEISYWLTLLLLKLPMMEQLQEKHTRISLGRGEDGKN